MGIERIGQAIYRVHDLDAAEAFYRNVVGLKLKFRDGDEWAAFDGGTVTFALEQESDRVKPRDQAGAATVAFRVNDLPGFAHDLRQRGGLAGPIAEGAHESRFSVADPDGNSVVFYEPAARPAPGKQP